MKSVAIMAAYNEESRIIPVINSIKNYVDSVIVVDDGSTDKTSEVAKSAGATVIRYETNRGNCYATRVGLKKAIEMSPDAIIIIDADGQHDPKYIPEMLKRIENGAEYVATYRDLTIYPMNRKIGNFGLTMLANILCPTRIRDTESGYRAISLEAAKKIHLIGFSYEREMDFIYNVWKNHLKISQIKIEQTKFISKPAVKRGLRNFIWLMKRRFGIIRSYEQ